MQPPMPLDAGASPLALPRPWPGSAAAPARTRAWDALVYAGLGLSMLSWVPLAAVAGRPIEVSNLVQAGFVLLLPALLLLSRPAPAVHALFGLLMAWGLVTLLVLSLHGDASDTPMIRQQLVAAGFGWALALCVANSRADLGRAAAVAALVLLAALELSARAAGASLLAGLLDFAGSLNRDRFVYGVVRPALNAFAHRQDDLVYSASQINGVANTLVLLAAVTALRPSGAIGARPLRRAVAAVALLVAFVVFSSSAVLAMIVLLLAALAQATARAPLPVRALLLLAVLALAVALARPLGTFLAYNIAQDEGSRGARIDQIAYALGAIDARILTGAGFSFVEGHVIHNWWLFSWATAGIAPFLLTLAVYATIVSQAALTVRITPSAFATVATLAAIFVVRTSVGGAGGVPNGPSILAAAILAGLLARGRRAPAAHA